MLFQQFYSWFQYKTLPPSFFAKNRLLIEREGKQNRIFNKVGLTFRNSKWSNYERNNLNFNFTIQIKIFFLGFLMSWYLLYFHTQLFNSSFSFFAATSFNYVFWLALDCCDYCLLFLIWLALSVLVIAKRVIFFIFFRDLSPSTTFADTFSNRSRFNHVRSTSSSSPFFERLYFQSEFEAKFKQNQFELNLQPSIASLITQIPSHRNREKEADGATLSLLLHYSFRMQFLMTRLATAANLGKFDNTFRSQFNSQVHSLNQPSLGNQHLAIVLFALLKQHAPQPYSHAQYFYFRKLQNQNFEFAASLTNVLNVPLSNRNLLLTFNERFEVNSLFSEFPVILTQNSVIDAQKRISRWLYTYSLLHRQTLSDVRRISQIKKLLNDNFILTANSQRNLWTSEILNADVSKLQFQTLYKTFTHSNLVTSQTLMTSQTQSPLFHVNETFLHQVCNLETSLNFSVKRIFFFDNLSWDSWCNQFPLSLVQNDESNTKQRLQLQDGVLDAYLVGDTFVRSSILSPSDFELTMNSNSHFLLPMRSLFDKMTMPRPNSISNLTAPSVESKIWQKYRRFWMLIVNDERICMRRSSMVCANANEEDCVFFYN